MKKAETQNSIKAIEFLNKVALVSYIYIPGLLTRNNNVHIRMI